jgi:hypothetical protein
MKPKVKRCVKVKSDVDESESHTPQTNKHLINLQK